MAHGAAHQIRQQFILADHLLCTTTNQPLRRQRIAIARHNQYRQPGMFLTESQNHFVRTRAARLEPHQQKHRPPRQQMRLGGGRVGHSFHLAGKLR